MPFTAQCTKRPSQGNFTEGELYQAEAVVTPREFAGTLSRYDVEDDNGDTFAFGDAQFKSHFERTETGSETGRKNYGSFRIESARQVVDSLIG